jgi:hypothetical protein
MTLREEQAAFLLDITRLIQFATKAGFMVTGGELYRTPEQQQIYIKTGRSKTMNSNHLNRCAIDLNFFINGNLTYDRNILRPIGQYWESLNPKNSWGGNWKSFKDVPHFERRV